MLTNEVLLKAVKCCLGGRCDECPLKDSAPCCSDDILTSIAYYLGSGENTDAPKYHTVVKYTKHTDLLPWFNSVCDFSSKSYPRLKQYYSQPRDVNLLLYVRHDKKGKCWAKIKCPINPLPIKGEFQIVSTSEMGKLLRTLGWEYAEKIDLNWLLK